MRIMTQGPRALTAIAALSLAIPTIASAQGQELPVDEDATMNADGSLTVSGMVPADLEGLAKGPDIEGMISARDGEKMQVTTVGGSKTIVFISQGTEIRAKGGFLGLSRTSLGPSALLNGLPVTIETVQWGQGLIASRVRVSNNDLETAQMIQAGTDQRFTANEQATEALRGRVADIDKYNIKGTTNVYFDTGKYNLSGNAQAELCSAAAQADAMDNALLLVVGYTDSTGTYEINQVLSEKRAARVVNYLQQQCGWKPWRMLTPTGMAEADPAADNTTEWGKQQNRRVAVNILVSKSVDGM
ncbi:OmpA family protein [Parerythrobacter aestuarii]|uniref:OmpA family protein n=1 Tax=Parerythrobacter aestuarii TaxID=3020909 RepID=UPI0024DEC3AB|nr:OmpA family protein [Parerythrobacter aestuarii]